MATDSCSIPTGAAGRLVEHYQMARIPHEGGWFALRWVSGRRAADGVRAAGNAILALLTRRDFSALHRLRTDEVWHFHGGDAAELLLLGPGGRVERRRLGANVFAGEEPKILVPAGTWMGARPVRDDPEAYSFFGCTLAPGFDYADYEPGYRDELQSGWPDAAAEIAWLTREDSLSRSGGARGAALAGDGVPGGGADRGEARLESRTFHAEELPAVELGRGVCVRELVGRTGAARTEALSVARFRLESGASTGSSRYLGCDEFFVVLGGEGVATVGKTESAVRAGSVVAIARGEPHALRAGAGGPLEFLAVLAPAFVAAHYLPEA
jgi:uncharacterized protein